LSKIDGYRKGWASRYLREAKAELTAAKKTPYMAAGFIIEALTKAQAAIYYSLGDPAVIASIVQETLQTPSGVKEPILNFLVEIEKSLQQMVQCPTVDSEKIIEHISDIIQFTFEIVELFCGEIS
jgi:hypothetical protein